MNANRPEKQRRGLSGALRDYFSGHAVLPSFARFSVTGLVATIAHGAVLNLLVLAAGLHPTIANIGAFLTAYSISYLGHYYFSFRSREVHAAAAPKFFIVALIGLALNTLIFVIVVNMLRWHYMIAFAAVIMLTPPTIFLISRKFVFTAAEPSAAKKRKDE